MNLSVAGGMEQHQVARRVASAVRAPDNVVDLSLTIGHDRLVAYRAAACLCAPQRVLPSYAVQGLLHGHAQAFLEIQFPGRVIRIGLCSHLHVPTNRHAPERKQAHGAGLPRARRNLARKDPLAAPIGRKVFLPHPARSFVGMSSLRPPPEQFEDGSVYGREGFLTHDMPVILRPAPQERVEQANQVSGFRL